MIPFGRLHGIDRETDPMGPAGYWVSAFGGSRRSCDFVFLKSVAGSSIVRRRQRHPLPFPFPFLEPFLFLQQRGARPDHHSCQRPPSPICRRFQQRPPSPIFPSICRPIILLSGAVILPPSALPAVAKNHSKTEACMKRPNRSESEGSIQHSRMKRSANSQRARNPSPTSSSDAGHSSEDLSGSVTSEEGMISKEPSMYDGLLMALQSGSKSFAELYKRRQREQEGRSDSDKDRDSDSPSASVDESDIDDGSEDDSDIQQMENELSKHSPNDPVGEADMEEDHATSDEDQENDLQSNSQVDANSSKSTSSFSDHLGRTLSEAEVEDLTKRKWKFKWEVPAISISSMSKWVGTGHCFLKELDKDSTNGLKQRLHKRWQEVYKISGGTDFHSSRQRAFFLFFTVIYYIVTRSPFISKLNHVYRTRDIVTKNDVKVAKRGDNIKEEIINDDRFLDHGFTRPKVVLVLILLPIRSIALRVIKRLIQLTPTSNRVNVEHFDRFAKEFGVVQDDDDDTELANNVPDNVNPKSQKPSKPPDFEALFGGNDDDHFMIGIKFTKKSIKLYSDFYSSDVIVASPLGLITKIGEAEAEKEKDVDYLSSIEVLIIDHADVKHSWFSVTRTAESENRFQLNWFLTDLVKLISEYKGILPKVLLQVRQIRLDGYTPENKPSTISIISKDPGFGSEAISPRTTIHHLYNLKGSGLEAIRQRVIIYHLYNLKGSGSDAICPSY
ncbi:hypothetical protein ACLOJK_003775 [Asimina triloba]